MKRKTRKTTKKRPTKNPILIKVCLVIIVLFILSATIFKITEFIISNKNNNFPKLEISLSEVPIEQINLGTKDIKYPHNSVTFYNKNDPLIFENVEIKGRGNFTWLQAKKSYQLNFAEKSDLFGYGNAKKWILLADYLDESHLRNRLAFHLQDILNFTDSINGDYAEIYIDNVYYGLYYITEKVEINKNRVNIDDPSGILVELDNLHELDNSNALNSKSGDHLTLQDTVNNDIAPSTFTNFVNKFNLLEEAAEEKNFQEVKKIIDVDSFAKYFLLNEFANNPDAYSSSFFLYMKDAEDKIHAGPGWDFDFAFGSEKWISDDYDIDVKTFLSPHNTMPLKKYIPANTQHNRSSGSHLNRISPLLYNLMEIPEFEARVKEIYQKTLSGKGEELLDYIKSQAEYIREAVLRDQERWKLKVNFDEEIDYLIDWVAKRYDHFEQTYGKGSTPIN